MTTTDRVRDIVAPLVADADLDLYDLDLAGGVLQVLVDKPGGADIGVISTLARTISRALDEHDPIDGTYALEVGLPGARTAAARAGPLRQGRGHHGQGQDQAGGRGRPPDRGRHHRLRRHRGDRAAGRRGRAHPPLRGHRASPHHLRVGRRAEEEPREDKVMSNIDFGEALAALAQDKGISVDTLLGALADALESAYKRMPGRQRVRLGHDRPRQLRHPGVRPGDRRGRRALRPRARRHAGRLRPDRRHDGPSGDDAAHPGGRARAEVRGVRRPRGRHRHGHHPADRQPLHPARPGPGGGPAAAGRAGALRAPRAQHAPQGVHRRGATHGQGPADRRVPDPPRPDPRAVQARGARDRRRHRRAQGLRPRARPSHQDRGLVERLERRPGRRLRRRAGAPASARS